MKKQPVIVAEFENRTRDTELAVLVERAVAPERDNEATETLLPLVGNHSDRESGIMGWAGVWLDMSTTAMTAMIVSIGADFAIYFVFRVREEWQLGRSFESAMRARMCTTGQAIFYASSVLNGWPSGPRLG